MCARKCKKPKPYELIGKVTFLCVFHGNYCTNSSVLHQVQIALNEAKLSEEKVKSECHRVQEENARLKKKKEQVRKVSIIG